jgi:predicted nucleic acid-binding protein
VELVSSGLPLIYVDANAVISFIEGGNDGLAFLLESSASDLLRMYTSELTLAEVLVMPLRNSQAELISLYEQFLTSDDVLEVVPVERTILRQSAENRATFGNKGPDAIHVATAVAAGCTVFISSDSRMRLPSHIKRVPVEEIRNLDAWR